MKKAVFTIAHNEKFFIPIWLKYYKKHFAKKDIYILDDSSSDNSTTNLDVNVIKLEPHPGSFDHHYLLNTVKKFQKQLLGEYETVLFTEIDEIVATNPRTGLSLSQYIEEMNTPVVRANGWTIVHSSSEKRIKLNKPIFQQRKYGQRGLIGMCKTLLSKVPLEWEIGFHTAFTCPDNNNVLPCLNLNSDGDKCSDRFRGLLLLHLHYFDKKIAWRRHNSRLQRGISSADTGGKFNKRIYRSKNDFIDLMFDRRKLIPLPEYFKDIDL